MDLASARLIVSLLQKDIQCLGSSSPQGDPKISPADAVLALSLTRDDLAQQEALLSDRAMAQSHCFANIRDANVIAEATKQELQAASDRGFAASLKEPEDTSPATMLTAEQTSHFRRNEDSIHLIPQESQDSGHAEPSDGIIDGSLLRSAFAEKSIGNLIARETKRAAESASKVKCNACMEPQLLVHLIQAPCKHYYCRECLPQLFENAIQYEPQFPPKCCKKPIGMSDAKHLLSADLRARFARKKLEFQTHNRTYCHKTNCSAFIMPQGFEGNCATCADCGLMTCSACKNVWHEGICGEDYATRIVKALAAAQRWQSCYSCGRIVELGTGCNHITCFCRAEFCYVCGERWKTCRCPTWDEGRLLAGGIVIPGGRWEGQNENPGGYEEDDSDESDGYSEEEDEDDEDDYGSSSDDGCDHPNLARDRRSGDCDECDFHMDNWLWVCRECRGQLCWRCGRDYR